MTNVRLVRQGVFVLATARGEWQPPEALRTDRPAFRYLEITLGALGDAPMRELVTQLIGRVAHVPAAVVDDLVARAEGVPYFAEELVNWFLDRGIIDASQTPWQFVPEQFKDTPLPATLQHLPLSRLWSLREVERAALQRGAIFGRHFWAGGVEPLGVQGSMEALTPLQPGWFARRGGALAGGAGGTGRAE
ncbi:MAG: hypothetical protein WCF84_03170 [Anaerolineae bacterium]